MVITVTTVVAPIDVISYPERVRELTLVPVVSITFSQVRDWSCQDVYEWTTKVPFYNHVLRVRQDDATWYPS